MTDETKETQPLLRDILNEMRAGFARMDERFTAIEVRLDRIEKELEVMSRQIGNLAKQMNRIVAEHEFFEERLAKLEGRSKLQ